MELNIVYIHTHDSGRFFSPYVQGLPTPRLQEFADEACCFTNCYCASPTCSPSRASLLTGQYPHTNGMLGLANRGFTLRDYRHHLANLLGRNGYETALCGIQHEYGAYSDHKGGSSAIGYLCNLTADNTGLEEKQLLAWDRQNAQNAAAFIGGPHQKPFFLSMGFFATHREYPPTDIPESPVLPSFLEDCPTTRRDFAGHMESLGQFDQNLGIVLDALRASGQYDHTLVVFTVDHGLPYPGAKCTLFDAGIGVALLMRLPGATGNGQYCHSLVSQVDLLPTICGLTGIKPDHQPQGVDISPLLHDPMTAVRNEIFAEINFHTSYEPVRCMRTQRWKYIRFYDTDYLHCNLSNIDNSISKDYYLDSGLLAADKPVEALYDLETDPLERNNLALVPAYAAQLTSCRGRLLAWQRKAGDYLPDGRLHPQPQWRVNRPQCRDPKSKDPQDFITLL